MELEFVIHEKSAQNGLLIQAEIALNLLRICRFNPKFSAYQGDEQSDERVVSNHILEFSRDA